MKQLKRTLFVLIIILTLFPVQAKADDTPHIYAGEAIITKDNFQVLAYKEMQRISNLLIIDPVQYMIEYNKILENYRDYLDNTVTIYEMFSSEDIEYLEKCVETETFGGTFLSKVNVAHVIINRAMDDEKFSSTLKGVVTTPGQFQYSKSAIDPLTIAACEYAAITSDTTNGALYFKSGNKTDTFNGATYIFTDDVGHHFYR